MSILSTIDIGLVPTDAAANLAVFRKYLSPAYKKTRPLFDTHDIDYVLRKGPGAKQERDYNAMNYVTISQGMQGWRGVYEAGSISKGMLANLLAAKEGPFFAEHPDGQILRAAHVYDMDETVGSHRMQDQVFAHNKRKQIQNHSLLRTVFNGVSILVPSMFQGSANLAGQIEFDRGAKRRDKGYMQVWTPVIRELCCIFPVVDDWFFSGATSGLEYPEAECIAAGLRDERPKADMWFLDWKGEPVSLYTMMCRRAEYLVWAAEHGNFYLKHEATAFMRSCAIAAMAAQGKLPRANPVFLQGILDNYADIRVLQKEMEPLILDRIRQRRFVFDTTDLEPVFPDFIAKVAALKTETPNDKPLYSAPAARANLKKQGIALQQYSPKDLAAGDFGFKEIAQTLPPESYLDLTANDVTTLPLCPVDLKSKDALLHDGRSLFSQKLGETLNERERHQVIASVGGLETVMPTGGRSLYIVAGEARKLDLPMLRHFPAQTTHVRYSSDFMNQAAAFNALKNFSMAPGAALPGQDAQTLIRQTVLARRTSDFCFVSGQWEASDSGVQDMVMATRMQMGLESASPFDPQFVRVFDEKGRYLTLSDRLTSIWKAIEPTLNETNAPATSLTEPISAVAQLYALHRLSRDHTLRHQVFARLREKEGAHIALPQDLNWERISPLIFAYDHSALDAFWNTRIKPVLETRAAEAVRLRHLDLIEDYREIYRRQNAAQQLLTAHRPPDSSQYQRSKKPLIPR